MAAPPTRTVRDIIERAYLKTGIYSSGESISSNDMNDGLMAFQDLLAEWAGNGMLIPSIVQEAVTLIVDQSTYTIGEDGVPDLDTVRPDQIITAFIRESNIDYPVKIIGEKAFARFANKSDSGNRPEYLWYNPTAPNGVINLYMTPSSTDSLYISSIKLITDGGTLTQDVMNDLGIPRNYATALIYNLAIDLLPENGIDPPIVVARRAEDTKLSIMSLNAANNIQAAEIEFARPTRRGYDLGWLI